MAVHCGTVTVLYCSTVNISVFGVMAVQCGTVTVLNFSTVNISVLGVMAMKYTTVTVLNCVTVYVHRYFMLWQSSVARLECCIV